MDDIFVSQDSFFRSSLRIKGPRERGIKSKTVLDDHRQPCLLTHFSISSTFLVTFWKNSVLKGSTIPKPVDPDKVSVLRVRLMA